VSSACLITHWLRSRAFGGIRTIGTHDWLSKVELAWEYLGSAYRGDCPPHHPATVVRYTSRCLLKLARIWRREKDNSTLAQIIKIAGGIILAVAVLCGFTSWQDYSEKQALIAACLRHDRNARYSGNLVIWKTGAYSFGPMSKAKHDGQTEAG
jgi:hypothetical protein